MQFAQPKQTHRFTRNTGDITTSVVYSVKHLLIITSCITLAHISECFDKNLQDKAPIYHDNQVSTRSQK